MAPADLTALNAYSASTERHRSGAVELPRVPPDLSRRTKGKIKKARVLGVSTRTDLVKAALGGEDGDVAVVARARAAAHLGGRRKISPELGVLRREGCVFVCVRGGSWVLGVHDLHTAARSSYSARRRRARSGPTQTRPDPGHEPVRLGMGPPPDSPPGRSIRPELEPRQPEFEYPPRALGFFWMHPDCAIARKAFIFRP